MGLFDSVRNRVTTFVTNVESKTSPAVSPAKDSATAVGHATTSTFSSSPAVPVRLLVLNPDLLRTQLTGVTPTTTGQAKDPDSQAAALIKKHTSKWGMLDEAALGKDLAALSKADPAGAAAVVKATFNKLPSSDVDDVAGPFTEAAGADTLRKLAELPDGADALKKAKDELRTGYTSDADQAAIGRIDTAVADAAKPAYALEKEKQLSALTYHTYGDKPMSLNDPEQVKQLIVNSPQNDDLTTTENDDTRCGGASLLNSMLLAGDPAANAGAIERTVAKIGITPTADQAAALAAMKSGSLTPHQAANLQELLTAAAKQPRPDDSGRPNFVRGGPAGFSVQAMADMVKQLRAEGAFANAKSVTFHIESNHFTTEVTSKTGVTTGANSAPQNGHASTDRLPPAKNNFLELTLKNLDDGKVTIAGRGAVFLPNPDGGDPIQLKIPPMESPPKDPKGGYDFIEFMVDFGLQKPLIPNGVTD